VARRTLAYGINVARSDRIPDDGCLVGGFTLPTHAEEEDHEGMSEAYFLYDGDCAFCSACARFIERRIPTSAQVQPWQFSDLPALGLTMDACDEAVQWVSTTESGRLAAEGPVAIAALLRTSTWFWRVTGRVLGWRPATAIAWPVYRWVSRHRDRMPGGTAACAVPSSQRALHSEL
jgi:predicted DCC family thiol-disulfide oxidoreductase YuxK